MNHQKYINKILLYGMITGLLFAVNIVYSQDIDYIKKSGKYYWGQGLSENERSAEKQATENFISELSNHISSKFNSVALKQKGDLKEYTQAILETYLNTSLKQMSSKVDRDATSVLTVKYIEKENLNNLFYDRKRRMLNYFEMAQKAEKENRISDALQKYYWTLLLLESHPENQEISIEQNNSEIPLIKFLPVKLDQILNNVEITYKSFTIDEQSNNGLITLDVKYDDIPVENLEYKYWMKNSWISSSCKNGLGGIKFLSLDDLDDSIRIEVEYRFEADAEIDNELTEIFENLAIPSFKTSQFTINMHGVIHDKTRPQSAKNKVPNISYLNIEPASISTTEFDSIIHQVVKSLELRELEDVRSSFTISGWKDINYLIEYGNAQVIRDEFDLKVIKVNNEYVVRKVPMHFKFRTNNKEFIEDLVFYFNDNLKVTGMSFSISDVAINDILNKKEEWGTIQDKYQIISFVENYKTAYCFKRLDYIEKIFDNDALIIVGRRLENAPKNENKNFVQIFDNEQIEYIRKTKEDYLKSLNLVFRSNEYVNIHFEDNEIKRTNKDNKIYGIQIAQYYTSTNYSDKGYLFLMVDLNDSLNPKIYVRTWQPQKNPDGSIIGLEDFRF